MSEDVRNAAKAKIQKVFTYIRELTKYRTPPVSQINSYDWSLRFSALTEYPAIQTATISDERSEDFDDVVLRVRRPIETPCPVPPGILRDWIKSEWDHIDKEPAHLLARNMRSENGMTTTEYFEDEPLRVEAFNEWQLQRKKWQLSEKPVREAAKVFSDFFQLHGKLQRESEKYQLFLGDGHLVWKSAIESIHHPLLLKKVELEFDSSVPEFVIRETDDPTELFTSLLRHHELDGKAVVDVKSKLDEVEPHPLSDSATVDFLKYFVQRIFSNGQFFTTRPENLGSVPAVYRDPVLFLGSRSQGFAEALDSLIESTPNVDALPEALLRIVGIDEKLNPETGEGISESASRNSSQDAQIDFLLTKPANKEQERVITRLEQTGSVLVQGPPGTGKSHTIANIIGHLLASGKTVLVSSHTSKALRVVREKVVKPLQPLCVSVLENDTESKSQLEESINGIVSYLSRTDSGTLSKEIEQLSDRRVLLKSKIATLEKKALEIRKSEYSDIVVAGEGTAPSEAARKVQELEHTQGWIPSPVAIGAPPPLSETELCELYATNGILSLEDEQCIREDLPSLEDFLKASELKEIEVQYRSVDQEIAQRMSEFWLSLEQNSEELERIEMSLKKAGELFSTKQWLLKVVEDSAMGPNQLKSWENLLELIESSIQKVGERSELILKHGPQASVETSPEIIKTCDEIVRHLSAGKSLGFFSSVFKSKWKEFITHSRVDDGAPTALEHFQALLALHETHQIRKDLSRRWERQVVALGGPGLQTTEVELSAGSMFETLKLAVMWNTSAWRNIEVSLEAQGFDMGKAYEKLRTNLVEMSPIEQIRTLIDTVLIPSIASRKMWLRLRELDLLREQTLRKIQTNMQKTANANSYLVALREAVERLDVEAYDRALGRLSDLISKVEVFNKRQRLIDKLKVSASGWGKVIELRAHSHSSDKPPGHLKAAWQIAQWRQELDLRNTQDYSGVQREIQRLKAELNSVNAQYVEKLAWRFQHSRTGLKEKQALTGWQQLQNKITKTGKGKRDAQLKREARKTLKDCKGAVPVWIMPLSRVFESFDLVQTKFDVILLDEASQSDITALVAFAIAKQVIVVGDNEQVTPYAVGQELGKIQALIDELLEGVPNKMLYDGKTSVYDLAEQAFGETIRLVEHFRCVPDIISFSNQLSYGGEIRPLREANSSPFKSHLVAHRVSGATSTNKTNQREALEVASIVAAMSETNEYADSSIGIISMVGQDQALVIDSLLQRRLPASVYAKHRLLCGNASQFQGDERDVMLISMVDTCDDPPLAIRQSDDFKKTFNVAASRARNQLWVIHSLNPSTDLKPGDLRLRLIQHAENPKALKQAIESTQQRADPKSVVFEPMVIRDLMLNGFRVTPQFEVGAYTIDMIVEGATKRVAIECDGDRYHPVEKLAEDMQRQMVLERLGWTFIRIRGSEYFRHRETTINRVVAELEAMGVERLGPSSNDSQSDQEDELRLKVLSRAQEIRQKWESSAEPAVEPKASRGRWGKKTVVAQDGKKIEAVPSTAPINNETDLKSPKPQTKYQEIAERLIRQHSSPDHTVSSEPHEWETALHQTDMSNIVSFLNDQGFEVIDKRRVGGCLWVIDAPKFKEISAALSAKRINFIFTANGSGATKDRPGWYIRRTS